MLKLQKVTLSIQFNKYRRLARIKKATKTPIKEQLKKSLKAAPKKLTAKQKAASLKKLIDVGGFHHFPKARYVAAELRIDAFAMPNSPILTNKR